LDKAKRYYYGTFVCRKFNYTKDPMEEREEEEGSKIAEEVEGDEEVSYFTYHCSL
jgi:hypothetical protein